MANLYTTLRDGNGNEAVLNGASFKNVTDTEEELLKTGRGVLFNIVMNKAGGTMNVYDAITATNPIASITPTDGQAATSFTYNTIFEDGLYMSGATGGDWTITFA